MEDYNDGGWHLWNGGECPVHSKTVVEAVLHDPNRNTVVCPAQGPLWRPTARDWSGRMS